jgi:adenylate cyclase class 2
MNIEGKELEVKFYLSRRAEMERKVSSMGKVTAPRVLEVNLRFDTPNQALTTSGKVLRLRRDTRVRVTYKGSGISKGGANLRQELEFTVSDFDTAKDLFEALGYEVYIIYEKYRTTYQMDNLEVVLDELPMGDFLEIEGADPESIRRIASLLGLNWEARILDSYTVLFERLREKLGLHFRDLSFDNFKGMHISPDVMDIMIADQP